MLTAVFVYGTLKRGQSRESMWPARPTRVCEAWVLGTLFGRRDYPAMTAGDHRVSGEFWQFQAELMPRVLHTLDQIEGTGQPHADDLYHRVIVEVFHADGGSLGRAYTYHYARQPLSDGFALIHPAHQGAYVAWPAGS